MKYIVLVPLSNKTPDGYTWHHHQVGKTMQLVPKNLHKEVKHTGGAAMKRDNR
jgi:hypothetical protein